MNIKVDCFYPLDLLYANVRKNSAQCSRWLVQAEPHDGGAVLCGGGPSLADNLDAIRWRASLGQTVFGLNGACRFLNSHGILPDYQVFLDANEEMGDRIGEAKEYLVCSQCSPKLFPLLPPERTILWHFGLPDIRKHIPEGEGSFTIVGGGVTVGLTSMSMAHAMGYRKLHLFGYDSSNRNGTDHAYPVPITEEKIGDRIFNSIKVTYGDKTFDSTLTMVHQAERFPIVCNDLIDAGTTITVDVDGNSLLAAVMQDAFNNPLPEAAE